MYESPMKDLMEQYKEAWERYKKEEEEYGIASVETEQAIQSLELKIEMFRYI